MGAHIKRLAAPKSWPIKRKISTFITKPNPGTHCLERCVPLNVLLRDMLGYARTTREVRKILNLNTVLIDCIKRKNVRFPVGIMDTVSIKEINKYYRVTMNKKGKIITTEIDKSEAELKPCKIINKSIIKGKIQLNLFDGRNILTDSKDTYKTNDTVIIKLPEQEIKEHLRLEKNAKIFLIDGKHNGEIGTVTDIMGRKIKYRLSDDVTVETTAKHVFVIGKDTPAVKVC